MSGYVSTKVRYLQTVPRFAVLRNTEPLFLGTPRFHEARPVGLTPRPVAGSVQEIAFKLWPWHRDLATEN
jgi:hypothetical protein